MTETVSDERLQEGRIGDDRHRGRQRPQSRTPSEPMTPTGAEPPQRADSPGDGRPGRSTGGGATTTEGAGGSTARQEPRRTRRGGKSVAKPRATRPGGRGARRGTPPEAGSTAAADATGAARADAPQEDPGSTPETAARAERPEGEAAAPGAGDAAAQDDAGNRATAPDDEAAPHEGDGAAPDEGDESPPDDGDEVTNPPAGQPWRAGTAAPARVGTAAPARVGTDGAAYGSGGEAEQGRRTPPPALRSALRRARLAGSALPPWWPAALCVLLGLLAGLGYGLLRPAQYTATSFVAVVPDESGDPMSAVGFAQAYGRIATESVVLARAQQESGVPYATLEGAVTASTSPDAPMIEITGRAASAGQAADVANAVARSLTRVAGRTAGDTGIEVTTFARARAPREPSTPAPALTAAVGGSGGVLVGALALLVRPRRDERALGAAAGEATEPSESAGKAGTRREATDVREEEAVR